MTISECTENLDKVADDVESLTQIPQDTKNNILDKIDELCALLDDAADDYGDDSDDVESDDE